MSLVQAAIALNRFGLGARPGELGKAKDDPRGWLKGQIRPQAALISGVGLPSAKEVLIARREAYGERPPQPSEADAPSPETLKKVQEMARRETRQGLIREIQARTAHGSATEYAFAERWARFWSNHFTVAARNVQTIGLVGPFEREAIRPHVFGRFADLLTAATFHPGMLVYLDANRSIGPSTQAAKRRGAGLNENLAREILELHTLGVGAGYTQADVIEFAKALTGWTLASGRIPGVGAGIGPRARAAGRINDTLEAKLGETVFLEPLHEPGARKVLGKSYNGGEQQASAILADLARHPATARRIAGKVARHFISDAPPASAVAKLEASFNRSNGDLAALASTLVELDEAWAPEASKLKTPEELLTSAARALDTASAFGRDAGEVLDGLSQSPFRAPSPAGWPDEAEAWAGSDAVMKRLEWANAAAMRAVRRTTPQVFLDIALGPLASDRTRRAVGGAETPVQGLTLALMSPEFQRR